MKKFLSLFLIGIYSLGFTQSLPNIEPEKTGVTANRFFYMLRFKPKQKVDAKENLITILDITPKKSIYQDYTLISQDSIHREEFKKMQRSGNMKDMDKLWEMPVFSHKITKNYPTMEVWHTENIPSGMKTLTIGYKEETPLKWKIESDKKTIGIYPAQKATTSFGGRKWTAYFTMDISIQDGPYKFYGLPGLIVEIYDEADEYHWTLNGNKEIKDYNEHSLADKLNRTADKDFTPLSKEKFDKTMESFRADPFSSFRSQLTPQTMKFQIPGMDTTVGEMIHKMENKFKDFFEKVDNPIEK